MWLLFKMELKTSTKLLEGTLEALDASGVVQHTFRVTSGLAGFQKKGDQGTKNLGPIPSCEKVGITSYAVKTKGDNQSDVKGVEGMFYHITPDPVKVGSVERSEFGIHFDANVPGSAGCIVLRDKSEWTRFKAFMKAYNKDYSHISLIVKY